MKKLIYIVTLGLTYTTNSGTNQIITAPRKQICAQRAHKKLFLNGMAPFAAMLSLVTKTARAPRPPLDTGDASSTGDIGDQFFPTPANGITLPDDVNVVHNLTVGKDLTIGGNLVINGTVIFHDDIVLQPICPDPDIAIRFNTCTGTEIARIYTPSTVGGIVVSTNAGVTENFRVQADGNSQVTGNATVTGVTYANGGVDRSTAATLSLGTTNATAITIGGANVIGIASIDGSTVNVGNTTAADVNIGNGAATVDITGSTISHTGLTEITAGNEIQFFNPPNTFHSGIKAGALGANTTTLVLPLANGAANNVLTNDGAANLSWNSVAGLGAFVQNGNAFGVPAVLGTTDAQPLIIRTGVGLTPAQTRMTFASTGEITAATVLYADAGVDRSTAATLSLGTTNATAINIGNGAATVDITGSTISHTGLTEITAGNEIQFFNPLDTFHTGIKAGALVADRTTLVLPLLNGAANDVLVNDGAANLSWGSIASVGAFVQNGNAFGVPAVLGTTDAQPLIIRTGVGLTPAQTRMTFASTGEITAATVLYADAGVDRSTAATLSLGTTNANAINIGNGAATVDITGSTISHTGLTEITAGNEIQFFNPLDTFHSGIKAGALGANTTTLVLPLANGAANNVLTNDGAANLSWNSVAGLGAFVQDGNAFGVPAVLGTTDAQPLIIRTGVGLTPAQTRMTFASTGEITAATVLYADAGVDRSTAATLSLGTTNATTVTIGNTGTTTMAVELPNGYITTGGNRYIHKTGTNNFFAGVSAGVTGATAAGLRNTGIGVNALSALTSIAAITGIDNTAIGYHAGAAITTANEDTAVGSNALDACTVGSQNTAVGFNALTNHTSGHANTALGHSALAASDLGAGNTALGFGALRSANSVTSLYNTAVGAGAGGFHTTGSYNTLLGYNTGQNLATGSRNIIIGENSGSLYTGAESNNIIINNAGAAAESNTIRIGTQGAGAGQQNRCFIAGITGAGPFANAVSIDSFTGQLGDVVSSRRYKENIQSLDSQDRFMQLNPVSFNYKNDPTKSTWYGLIAEEVEPIYPELAVYGKDKQLESVSYLKLDGILIKEIQQNKTLIQDLQKLISDMQLKIAALEAKING